MSLSLTFSSVESVRLLTAPPSFDSLYLLSLGYDAIKERKSQKKEKKKMQTGGGDESKWSVSKPESLAFDGQQQPPLVRNTWRR